MTTKRMAWVFGALVLSASVGTSVAEAQSAQLQRITARLERGGYGDTGIRFSGALYDGDAAEHVVFLSAGFDYLIHATCDGDCTDVDLRLFSPRGYEVVRDLDSDDIPRITYRPSQSGRFTLQVPMAACSVQPCGYSVAVLRR
jgi:hypothetical protein